MIRQAVLALSRSERIKNMVEAVPWSRAVVDRFVAGATADDAVRAVRRLSAPGLTASIDHLGEDTTEREHADAVSEAYLEVLGALRQAELTAHAEVSVKLSAVGQALPADGEKIALDNARRICNAARNAGTTVTLDMEDHTTTDSTLGILRELRQDFPETGAVLQAYLRRTEADCRDLAYEGSRVRLCKGAYKEPQSVAFQERNEVDQAYVRCLKILFSGPGYPMVATHDPRLIEIAGALAVRNNRAKGSYEFQMLYGVRPQEQLRLAQIGERVRVYVPYGDESYGYLMRRMAERPANLMVFLRSLTSRN